MHPSDILVSLKSRPFAQEIAVKSGFVAIEPERGAGVILCHVMQVRSDGFAAWKRRTTRRKPFTRTQLRTVIGSIRGTVKKEDFGSPKTIELSDAQNLLGGARIEYVICKCSIRRRYQATKDTRTTLAVAQKVIELRIKSSDAIVHNDLENKSADETDHKTRRLEQAALCEYIALY